MQALSDVVRVVNGEDLVVHILRALQALATVAGVLALPDVTLATVAAVCEFTSTAAPAELPVGGSASPAAAAAGPEGEVAAAERAESSALGSVAADAAGDKGFSPMDRVGAMARPAMMCAHPAPHVL